MEIIIKDIPEEGTSFHWDSKVDAWFALLMKEVLAEFYQPGDHSEIDLHFFRTGENVDLTGELRLEAHPTCGRCLKVFKNHIDVGIHLTLAPLFENQRQLELESKEEVELIKEDLEFSYYEGESFDISAMIREQVILALPMQPLCQESCKGLCTHCGKDWNEGSCDCQVTSQDPRWEPLKRLKVKS